MSRRCSGRMPHEEFCVCQMDEKEHFRSMRGFYILDVNVLRQVVEDELLMRASKNE